MLARSHQLLGQLTSIKTMLMIRRERLQLDQLTQPLQQSAEALEAALLDRNPGAEAAPAAALWAEAEPLPDPFESDLTPWLLRRLALSCAIARQLGEESRVFGPPPSIR
jgi:hypothetical protein